MYMYNTINITAYIATTETPFIVVVDIDITGK